MITLGRGWWVVIQPNSEKTTCSLRETCGIVHQFRYECQKKKKKKIMETVTEIYGQQPTYQLM